jgi:hypothetical protein
MRARALLLAAVLLVGGACSGGSGLQGVSSDRAPAGPSAGAATNIPPPGAVARQAPPELPERGPGMPADTLTLEELHRQGGTDVVR